MSKSPIDQFIDWITQEIKLACVEGINLMREGSIEEIRRHKGGIEALEVAKSKAEQLRKDSGLE